jgi:hypothetical protein
MMIINVLLLHLVARGKEHENDQKCEGVRQERQDVPTRRTTVQVEP